MNHMLEIQITNSVDTADNSVSKLNPCETYAAQILEDTKTGFKKFHWEAIPCDEHPYSPTFRITDDAAGLVTEVSRTDNSGKLVRYTMTTKAADGSWSTPKAHFSLSHSGNALAVAVSRAPVGVDIESQDASYRDEMSQRMMTPSELAHFRQLPAEAQKAYFLTLWTAKEAIFKAAHNDAFRPAEIEAASFGCKTIPFTVAGQDYTCSVATNTPERLRIYEGISL